jgi:hypothetical protein
MVNKINAIEYSGGTTAARAEAATFTAERDQLRGVALATPDSQKTILEPATLEEILELAFYKGR